MPRAASDSVVTNSASVFALAIPNIGRFSCATDKKANFTMSKILSRLKVLLRIKNLRFAVESVVV